MNLNRKLEEIRQKPEHIRLRYVWMSVIVCMIFIVLVWILSFKQNIKSGNEDKVVLPDFKGELESQGQNMPSIDSLMNENGGNSEGGEGIVNNSQPSPGQ